MSKDQERIYVPKTDAQGNKDVKPQGITIADFGVHGKLLVVDGLTEGNYLSHLTRLPELKNRTK